MNVKNISAYDCTEKKKLSSLNSTGYLLKHKKTKANVVIIENKDENKVFSIGFRTPPKDSTGAAHIVEHTLLCGSKEFPAKDPFVELMKGSLNTFLNAMTFPDKTIYPVASCNDKDFQNLCHVYLDAVFYPNIYRERMIFEQEGWHYELESDELKYNGVVFNEMKGAFSSPEQLLNRLILRSLFPDNEYSVESGGEPEKIPDLTYENFLDFHKAYYHPSNSYIYLYGDMDMEEKLNWVDQAYLSNFEYQKPNSEILPQKPFDKMAEVKEYYSLTDGESTKNKTYFSYNAVIDRALNRELYQAFMVLEHVLVSTPGAPVKQALIDAGIGSEVISSFDNGILQPVFTIILKNTESKQKETFIKVIFDTLKKLVEEGLDEKALHAAVNHFEFKNREADFGLYPKGLIYAFQVLDSWLYDKNKPFLHLEANEVLEYLKKQIGTDYYEKLIEKYLLNNLHTSFVTVEPKVGLTNEIEKQERKILDEHLFGLSESEKIEMKAHTEQLRKYQEEPSSKEDLEKIPLLSISDIDRKAKEMICEEVKIEDTLVLKHDVFTNGIAYLRLAFDVTDRREYAPYLGLLVALFGYISTKNYTYLQLSNEIDLYTGGIANTLNVFEEKGGGHYRLMFDFHGKVLYDNIPKAFELIREMMMNTIFDDEKRLREIIAEIHSRYQINLQTAGHSTAAGRCLSYGSEAGFVTDMTKGIGYYHFLTNQLEHFEECKKETILICKNLVAEIFRKDNFIGSVTAEKEGFKECEIELKQFISDVLIGEKTKLP
ncbi:MAG: insulinase family protein, partial [Lachnoclostridium sp.]|nr:insulinase family protein [Lachnoclostridium sp.]